MLHRRAFHLPRAFIGFGWPVALELPPFRLAKPAPPAD
jgi:hypothetical protein